jgi:hypothetical protein
MEGWIRTIDTYGALGVLVIIFFLFAIGKIISASILKDTRKTFQETIDRMCKGHTEQVEIITKTYEEQVENITRSFKEQVESLKQVIEIMKRRNGG